MGNYLALKEMTCHVCHKKTQRNFKCIWLIETRQSEKSICEMVPLQHSGRKQNYGDIKKISGCHG